MEENGVPGLAQDGISGDIFHLPSGTAHEATKLMFGDWLDLVFAEGAGGSGSATILTHMAGYVNFLAYILITVIMSYVLIASVIKTASEGTVGGRGWSMVWLPLRTFLAVFLIFPVGIGQASSISFIQVAVVWLGSIGSNAADNVADYVVNNLEKKAVNVNSTINGYQTVMDMTDMAFCAAGFNKGLNNYNPVAEFYGQVQGIDNYSLADVAKNAAIPFGNIKTLMDSLPNEVAIEAKLADDYNTIQIGHKGKCGNITLQAVKGQEDVAKGVLKIAINTQKDIFNYVVKPMVEKANAATYKNALKVENIDSEKYQELRQEYENAVIRVMNIMTRYEEEVSSLFLNVMEEQNDLVSFNKKESALYVSINSDAFGDKGWPYLGAYYTTLSTAIGKLQNLSQTAVGITTTSMVDGCKEVSSSRNSIKNVWGLFGSDDDEVCQYTEVYDSFKFVSDAVGNLNRTSGNIDRMTSSACTDSSNCDLGLVEKVLSAKLGGAFTKSKEIAETETSVLARDIIGILGWGGQNPANFGLNDIITEDNEKARSLGALYISDPITYTASLGRDIAYSAHGLRFALKAMSGLAEASSNTGIPFVNGVTAFFGGMLTATIDFISTLLKIIYPQATAMAFFIPILPALIWGMTFISWLLMFAEAVFNAPLAVTLLATPEGEGIAGSRMERKIAMIAALVLKPTFLVFGLLLSMMILGIGFVFLNQIFWMAAGQTTASFDPIAIVGLITIWFTIMTVFMHNAFKIIPTFADNSLEWFLGGITNKFGNDLDNTTANEFKGSQGSTSSLGEMTGGAVGVMGKGVIHNARSKKGGSGSSSEGN